MNKISTPLVLVVIVVFFSFKNIKHQEIQQQKIKIACVGDSITYGAHMSNRRKNAYPMQLQQLLGDNYTVRNFGVNGRTLLKKGDYPYWKTDEYKQALKYKPDIVYIKLGTNDSKKQNRLYYNEFEENYNELISNFKKVNKKVRVVLLLPVPSYIKDSTQIWNPIIDKYIIPKTRNVALNNDIEIIDLNQLFVHDSSLLLDKVHPSSIGANIISKRLYENVVLQQDNKIDFENNKSIKNIKKYVFYGYKQLDFKFNNWDCKIVKPKLVANGKPWVIRARFWGHEPQTDIALLERGFHIAFCDVSNLFGSNEAIKRWDSFYNLMIKEGLSKKVVLEGMSRGGLIIYNWAVENPEKVACIYADAPVLDGKSWPGGLGKGKGSVQDWNLFKKTYQLTSKKSIDNFSDNPIHKINEIVKSKIPLIHICGEADKVVPVDENTRLFEMKIKKAGGNITTIYKKNVGHHPHSLKNPIDIVNFILRATGQNINFATKIAPGFEYRLGAGWKKGSEWWKQMNDIDSLCMNNKKIDILLIGNSISQGFGGKRPNVTHKPGENGIKKYFKKINFINAGISGDKTENVAWRIKNGHYESCNPRNVVLTIGVNNFPYNTAEEIAKGIKLDVNLIRKKIPNAKILLLGPLPIGILKESKYRKKYNKVHQLISDLNNKTNIKYIDLISHFIDEKGILINEYYHDDGVHLKPKGYEVWADLITKNI